MRTCVPKLGRFGGKVRTCVPALGISGAPARTCGPYIGISEGGAKNADVRTLRLLFQVFFPVPQKKIISRGVVEFIFSFTPLHFSRASSRSSCVRQLSAIISARNILWKLCAIRRLLKYKDIVNIDSKGINPLRQLQKHSPFHFLCLLLTCV